MRTWLYSLAVITISLRGMEHTGLLPRVLQQENREAADCKEGITGGKDDVLHAIETMQLGLVTLLCEKTSCTLADANHRVQALKGEHASLAALVIEKADVANPEHVALLKLVRDTANVSLLYKAAHKGWHQGLAVLLERFGLLEEEAEEDILLVAMRSRSVDCCKLLVEEYHKVVTGQHIRKAWECGPEVLKFLLRKFRANEDELQWIEDHGNVWQNHFAAEAKVLRDYVDRQRTMKNT